MEDFNVKLTLAYDGTDFHGFQRQPGLRTVQGELETWLSGVAGQAVEVIGASRTDAGVHARAQAVQFDAVKVPIPIERLLLFSKGTLPPDIVVTNVEKVPENYHVRFNALWKTYRYVLDLGKVPDVFQKRFAYHVATPIIATAMQTAADQLLGTHDFTSFCTARAQQENKVRTIYQISCQRQADDLMYIDVTGNGFLHHMVRNIVGSLVAIGNGKMAIDAIPAILNAKDRRMAGPTAPAHGLTLWHIEYQKRWS